MQPPTLIIHIKIWFSAVLFLVTFNLAVHKESNSDLIERQLADKLTNPVANLISIHLHRILNYGIDPFNGSKYTINFQLGILFKLTGNLNLITCYVSPVVNQRDLAGKNTHQFGLSDATVTAFFAPKSKGLIYGFGPAFLMSTATDIFFGSESLE
ncbi:hypothetical protein [Flavobacterium sp. LHD-85]|uniref:hypothetical protein n=1 Tax=Flavobacterium sp. LHD-85 TaxID=3071410 RepID=UPI0027DFF5FA|nr:hypothetical protein [Flavobacterium sp. LHD-85]MDQ6532177.1 hypothetical protein [Flavobacterium sp. LHD-85]